MFSTVTSWLGVGTRPKDDDENKENETHVHSESKDSISSTSVETSVSSQSVLAEIESSDGEAKASSTSEETSQNTSPLDTLEDVSAKALNTAKEFGNILFSFGKAAGKTVADTAKQLKHTVEEKTILGDFTKEQSKFVEANKEKTKQEEAAVPPWVGYNDEENLKTQILALSLDKRNFVRSPPAGVQFKFDFNSSYPIAQETLQEDPNLQKMRFDVVPKVVTEETFWANYFYRVSLIRQSSQLASSLAQSGKSSSSSSRRSSTGSEQKDSTFSSKTSNAENQSEEEVPDSTPANEEFVSDAFGDSQMTEEDIRKEMEQHIRVGEGPNGPPEEEEEEEDWKKRLEDKLIEQQVLELADEDEDDDNNNDNSVGSEEDWEKELMDELMDMKN